MAKYKIEDSDLAREVNDTSGHPLRKSPSESDAEYAARVKEFMADREVVATEDEDVAEFDREANESDDVELPNTLKNVIGEPAPRDEDEDEFDLIDTRADDEGETRAFDTPGETR